MSDEETRSRADFENADANSQSRMFSKTGGKEKENTRKCDPQYTNIHNT